MVALSLGLILWVAAAAADDRPLEPRRFADGYTIETGAGAPIYRVALTEAVYHSVQSADLADLRVFNAAGESVPHAIRRPVDSTASSAAAVPLPFYRLDGDDPGAAARALHLEIAGERAVIDVAPSKAGRGPAGAYLIDAGEGRPPVESLELAWQPTGRAYLDSVELSTSGDLRTWRALGSATLADLEQGGHRLEQRRIPVTQPHQRYLRLVWPAGRQALALTGVKAQLRSSAAPLPRRWSGMTGSAATAPVKGFVFDTGARLPVDGARVVLQQDNSLLQVRWYSRPAPDAAWRELGTALAYRLNREGTQLQGPELPLARNRDRYWRIELVDGDAAALGSAPRIELGWLPDEVLFMARGAPPFQLAAGAVGVAAPGTSVDLLLGAMDTDDRVRFSANAQLGERRTLGGEAALRPPPAPLPWQRYLLWSVLVMAVLLLARMAQQLFRQMNQPPGAPGAPGVGPQ
jgi:hypothetical protein